MLVCYKCLLETAQMQRLDAEPGCELRRQSLCRQGLPERLSMTGLALPLKIEQIVTANTLPRTSLWRATEDWSV